MKRCIFVVMFLVGLGNTVFSQNKTTEKVVTEYHVPFFPDGGQLHGILHDNKKLEKFILKSDFIKELNVDATHIVIIEEVVKKGKKFFRLKEIITEYYPKVVDSLEYQIPCYSKTVQLSKKQIGVEIYCVAGELALNPDVQKILGGLFNEEKVINPGLRFIVTLKDTNPGETDITLKTFSLQSVVFDTYPKVIKK